MEPRHWRTLELSKILDRLASHTSFSVAAEKARDLTPSTLRQEVYERLETTSEARALLEARPNTSVGGARDIRAKIEATRRGVVLPPIDLLDIRETLTAARSLQQIVTRLTSQFPRLAETAERIAACPDLVADINRCLNERGEVKDEASPELARLRKELRLAHDRLMSKLEQIVSSPRNATYLQEEIITQRGGRYVIPLKADFKGRIRGVVHDRSASGATLFIEPLGVVDLNNTWRELQIEEEQEVHRILANLSAQVADRGAEIEHTVDALADLDLAFAKARYAEELEASAPDLASEPLVRFVQARHPLLHPETVVPIDVTPDEETQIVVITGPNTGGKTVALKTIGLLTLMAQAGLHIPVAPGSALYVFQSVYADIGDEQSIEQSLSTFSAHLTNILSFVDKADRRSLVLLDELGAGTDPTEGSALAQALLDTFRQRGATTFVATHYPELKAYAQLTPGVKNASVEFDPQTLRPTYRLAIGLAGQSNAFAIARRLGLHEPIVREAESHVTREDRRTEDMLADLHRLRVQAAQARDAVEAARAEARRRAEELERRLAHIEEERAQALEAARQEAAAELEAFREEIRDLRQELHAAGASLEGARRVERAVEELEEVVEEPLAPPSPAPRPSQPVCSGDTVWVEPLRAEGRVLSVEDGEAEVQVGPARTRVGLAQLEPRATPEIEPEPGELSYEIPSADVRLDLRGRTVEEALEELDRHLDAASLAGLPWVQIVHGKGTGALRQAVREFLRGHALVDSFRPGELGEGGEGVTVAELE